MAGPFDIDVAAGLVRTVLLGAPLVAMVAAAGHLLPGLPAAARVVAWWLVALRLALWLVPVPTLPLAVLPPPEARAGAMAVAEAAPPRHSPIDTGRARHAAAAAPARVALPSWTRTVSVAWGVGLVAIGLASLVRRRRARVIARAATGAPGSVTRRAADLAAGLGLRKAPEVRVSARVTTPQVGGLIRPTILLPARAVATLDRDDLDMVLCHELLHVRRRDLWLGLVPAAARWLLWFNPAAHVAAREYVLAREAACDAEVLDWLGVEPRRYGQLLLSFGASRAALGGAAAGGSFTTLKRRLTMLDSKTRSTRLRRAGWAMPACAAFALVPISFVARPHTMPHSTAPAVVAADQAGDAPAAPAPAHAAAPAAPAHAPATPRRPATRRSTSATTLGSRGCSSRTAVTRCT